MPRACALLAVMVWLKPVQRMIGISGLMCRSSRVGLDHGVGHLVLVTTPDHQRLDLTEGCNQKATSPSLAITHTQAKDGNRR
jgi:hypothetical protein